MRREELPEIPDVPGWDDDIVRDELEFQREFQQQGRLEEQRLQNRWLYGDPDDQRDESLLGIADQMFSLDDGRPGLDPDVTLGSRHPLYWIIGAALLLLLGINALLRTCTASPAPPPAGQPSGQQP